MITIPLLAVFVIRCQETCQSMSVADLLMVKFHYADFPETSPRQFLGSRRNGILALKGTSRVCYGLVADVTGKSAWWNLGFTHAQRIFVTKLRGRGYVIGISDSKRIGNFRPSRARD